MESHCGWQWFRRTIPSRSCTLFSSFFVMRNSSTDTVLLLHPRFSRPKILRREQSARQVRSPNPYHGRFLPLPRLKHALRHRMQTIINPKSNCPPRLVPHIKAQQGRHRLPQRFPSLLMIIEVPRIPVKAKIRHMKHSPRYRHIPVL